MAASAPVDDAQRGQNRDAAQNRARRAHAAPHRCISSRPSACCSISDASTPFAPGPAYADTSATASAHAGRGTRARIARSSEILASVMSPNRPPAVVGASVLCSVTFNQAHLSQHYLTSAAIYHHPSMMLGSLRLQSWTQSTVKRGGLRAEVCARAAQARRRTSTKQRSPLGPLSSPDLLRAPRVKDKLQTGDTRRESHKVSRTTPSNHHPTPFPSQARRVRLPCMRSPYFSGVDGSPPRRGAFLARSKPSSKSFVAAFWWEENKRG